MHLRQTTTHKIRPAQQASAALLNTCTSLPPCPARIQRLKSLISTYSLLPKDLQPAKFRGIPAFVSYQ